jgi:hypothetical protein
MKHTITESVHVGLVGMLTNFLHPIIPFFGVFMRLGFRGKYGDVYFDV